MVTTLTIRDEQPADAAGIERLITDAFLTARHSSGTEAAIVAALRDAGVLSISLVAEERGVLVGHVALSPITTSSGDAGWYGLGPIAVAPATQRHGVGSRLMQASLDRLRAMGAAGCVVLGDPAFYSRFGFACDPGLSLPGVPPQYFQAIALGGQRASGVVAYHDAFSASLPNGGPGEAREWPPELDALVAAPAQHRLVLENERVRVLDTRIEPGETTPIHTHRWPAVHHVRSWSPFVRRDAAGHVMLDSRAAGLAMAPGTSFWGDALGPHSLENVGDTVIHVLSAEIKS